MAGGSLAYEVRIQVYADFDGVLPAPEAGADLEAEIRTILKTAAQRDPDALARDVYHSERHLLCPGCRDRYLANPLNVPLREEAP
jgi:hypothetical protein